MKKLKNRIHSVLTVIRRRYSLQEVPRRGIHNAIANAMSICVAVGNKVMDTHLPLPVGSGDKYDVESRGQYGRSMIEMLGVLAIIAVLSVGGIAGYSKAIQKWKENKQIEQVTGLIFNVLNMEYDFADYFRKSQTNILDGLYILKQLNQLPDGVILHNNRVAVDVFGNYYEFVYYGGLCGHEQLPCEGMYFFMRLAQNASGITLPARTQCQNIIKIVSKFDSENYNIRRLEFRDNDVKNDLGDPTTKAIICGKSNCRQNSKCFNNITLDEAYNFCKLCESGNCALVLYMGR